MNDSVAWLVIIFQHGLTGSGLSGILASDEEEDDDDRKVLPSLMRDTDSPSQKTLAHRPTSLYATKYCCPLKYLK